MTDTCHPPSPFRTQYVAGFKKWKVSGADLAEEEGVGRYQLVSAHPRRVLSDPRPA